jgi:hypothetical protein
MIDDLFRLWGELRDKGAAEADTLRGALRPDGLQVYADRRENRDMQNGQDVVREFFLSIEFDGDAAKA